MIIDGIILFLSCFYLVDKIRTRLKNMAEYLTYQHEETSFLQLLNIWLLMCLQFALRFIMYNCIWLIFFSDKIKQLFNL